MKLLFENFRKFINEETRDTYGSEVEDRYARSRKASIYEEEGDKKDVKKTLDSELDKEGGAAGLDPLVAAAKEKDPDITKDEVKQMLDAMSNVGQHEEGDYIDKAQLEEAVSIYLEAKRGTIEEGEKDACYKKVKPRYKVWPSAYGSGALSKCRKVGAANWGTGGKKKKKKK
jgi:hypothetical protein